MSNKLSKVAIAACAVIAGMTGAANAATIIGPGTSATVGGWNVSVPIGIGLAVDSSDNGVLVLEKTANFTSNTGLTITFAQVAPGATPQVKFQDEAVANNTGGDWSSFTFSLTPNATFSGLGDAFAPPFGTGVNFTSVSLNAAKDTLAYSGLQANGSISNWGGSDPTSGLLINAAPTPGASESFTFTETPSGGGSVVPVPAAAWQSLAGLAGLGLWLVAKKAKPMIR